jgi:hypothetical protein
MNAPIRSTLLSALALAALLPTAGCDTIGPLVLQSSEQSIEAYEVLTREWIRWAMITPHSVSPIADETGEFCDVNQGDGPWFLAGSYGGPVERDCTIPADTPLFFPLVNRWIVPSNDWVEQPGMYEEYVAWLAEYQAESRASTCELTLRIDGEELLEDTAALDAELYVAIDEPFSIELDADNFWVNLGYEKPAGTYDYTVADGHWALFKPLAPGEHLLEFGGKICEQGEIVFETSAVYHLHVEGTPEPE